jgi:hypothetical protein
MRPGSKFQWLLFWVCTHPVPKLVLLPRFFSILSSFYCNNHSILCSLMLSKCSQLDSPRFISMSQETYVVYDLLLDEHVMYKPLDLPLSWLSIKTIMSLSCSTLLQTFVFKLFPDSCLQSLGTLIFPKVYMGITDWIGLAWVLTWTRPRNLTRRSFSHIRRNPRVNLIINPDLTQFLTWLGFPLIRWNLTLSQTQT